MDIAFIPDEANSVLSILDKRAANLPIEEPDWQTLFASEGYIRLKAREASIGRPFNDDEFKAFVLTDDLLSRRESLAETLQIWQGVSLESVLSRTYAYLPAITPVRAKIYPVIKPKTNSFVFELESNPAIFLYLDPHKNQDQLENILAHELHHIGLGPIQAKIFQSEDWKSLPEAMRQMLQWVGAFGEGIAMLAAAGGPDVHPHACGDPEDRERWDQSMRNFEVDFHQMEAFLLQILDGTLYGQAMMEAGFAFFGIQGPWYTVGWQMAVTIERALGRGAVIEAFGDPRKMLAFYNHAAGPGQPKWDERLLLGRN